MIGWWIDTLWRYVVKETQSSTETIIQPSQTVANRCQFIIQLLQIYTLCMYRVYISTCTNTSYIPLCFRTCSTTRQTGTKEAHMVHTQTEMKRMRVDMQDHTGCGSVFRHIIYTDACVYTMNIHTRMHGCVFISYTYIYARRIMHCSAEGHITHDTRWWHIHGLSDVAGWAQLSEHTSQREKLCLKCTEYVHMFPQFHSKMFSFTPSEVYKMSCCSNVLDNAGFRFPPTPACDQTLQRLSKFSKHSVHTTYQISNDMFPQIKYWPDLWSWSLHFPPGKQL